MVCGSLGSGLRIHVTEVDPAGKQVTLANGLLLTGLNQVEVIEPYQAMTMIRIEDYTLVAEGERVDSAIQKFSRGMNVLRSKEYFVWLDRKCNEKMERREQRKKIKKEEQMKKRTYVRNV